MIFAGDRAPHPVQPRHSVQSSRVAQIARRNRIAFWELWDEPFAAARPETGWWRGYWLAADERQGHPVRIGAVTDQPQ